VKYCTSANVLMYDVQLWNELAEELKKPYYLEAERIKNQHRQDFPGECLSGIREEAVRVSVKLLQMSKLLKVKSRDVNEARSIQDRDRGHKVEAKAETEAKAKCYEAECYEAEAEADRGQSGLTI